MSAMMSIITRKTHTAPLIAKASGTESDGASPDDIERSDGDAFGATEPDCNVLCGTALGGVSQSNLGLEKNSFFPFN